MDETIRTKSSKGTVRKRNALPMTVPELIVRQVPLPRCKTDGSERGQTEHVEAAGNE